MGQAVGSLNRGRLPVVRVSLSGGANYMDLGLTSGHRLPSNGSWDLKLPSDGDEGGKKGIP